MARTAVARAAALNGGAADRYPCGKLKPTHPPATIKRIVESALRRGENPLLGTPIGWLLLHNEITAKQASAGDEYGRLRSTYDRLFGLPRRSARTLGDLGEHGHRSAWSGEAEATDEDALRVRRRFDELRDKVMSSLGTAGTKTMSILDDTCVDLQMPTWQDQILLRRGLDKVAEHFRIGDAKLAA